MNLRSKFVIHHRFASLQMKRLKLRRNNWDTDTYEFDEVLTEFSSQKRVYEVVAKSVVEVHMNDFSLYVCNKSLKQLVCHLCYEIF